MGTPGDEEATQPNRYAQRYAKAEPIMDRCLLWLVNRNWSLAIVAAVLGTTLGLGGCIGWWLAR